MSTFMLKKMQQNGYLLRQIIETVTNRSFGVRLVDQNDLEIATISQPLFAQWEQQGYVVESRQRPTPRQEDFTFHYYTLSEEYQFDLATFGMNLKTLKHQHEETEMWQNPLTQHVLTESEWNYAGELLNRSPPLFTLDEILVLAKLSIPNHPGGQDLFLIETIGTFYGTSDNLEALVERAYENNRSSLYSPMDFYQFRELFMAFARLEQVRNEVRRRR